MVYVDKEKHVTQLNFLASGRFQSFTEYADSSVVGVIDEGDRKILPAGTIYPSNDTKAKGIVINDVDVTNGAVPIGLIVEGYILAQRLPVAPTAEAKTAMTEIKWRDEAPAEA